MATQLRPERPSRPRLPQKPSIHSKTTMSTSTGYRKSPQNDDDESGYGFKSHHSIGSIRSSSGMCMIINTLLLFMTLLMAGTWRLRVTRENKRHYEDINQLSLYFIGSLLLPLLIFLLIYLKQICTLHVSISPSIASCLMSIFCFICGVLMLLSAGFLLPQVNARFCSDRRACPHLRGTLLMGLLTGLGVIAQSISHFAEINRTTYI